MKSKSDSPAADVPAVVATPPKSKTILVRPIDQERIDFLKRHAGIDNETDIIRHALAIAAASYDATKGGVR